MLLPTVMSAQVSGPVAPACVGGEWRQLDFWIGNWNVVDTAGTVTGTSVITATLNGCAISEEWTSGQRRGVSISNYDPSTGMWYQSYVDNAGRSLRLEGKGGDGGMVLEGLRRTSDGREARQRLTWTRETGGRVRQLWQSSDDGRTWITVFDGRYVPARGNVEGLFGLSDAERQRRNVLFTRVR
jgi:hypothetical protein